MNKLSIVVPARLNSSRIKHKPFLRINGKTLVENVVEVGLNCKYVSEVIVTSESKLVFNLFNFNKNVKCIQTSDLPLTGTDRLSELLNIVDSEYYLLLPCDIYLIGSNVLNFIYETLLNSSFDVGCLVTKLKYNEIYTSDDVKMLIDNDNCALNFIREIPQEYEISSEYENSVVKQLGVYIYTRKALLKFMDLRRDLLELVHNNESYRFIHNGMKMMAIFIGKELYSLNSNEDIKKMKEKGYYVQHYQ
ncbi:hypothetical protein PSI19_18960 [Xenorhabdus khoisanae]|uniref:cytidylyltransferase domain-containing protein n=1 Tax=Xenorhabdus khoisanae TaxID=880157 RepID=UPI0023590FBD|nr:NTP transferase domain-containing protein [Xenorhabdus khoisanae]MDC9615911.1 hypothetical protein [Xenorhabdus khoisanae]